MTGRQAWVDAASRAAVAELVWRRPDGALHAAALTPLVGDGRPLFALPFHRSRLAEDVGRAAAAALVLSDSRLARKGWRPMAAAVTLTLEEDRKAAWARTDLLQQELIKHPPSRGLIDTPLLRREHWWYLPRWLVRVDRTGAVWSVARRRGPHDGVLVTAAVGALRVDTVEVADWEADPLAIRSLSGQPIEDAPASLLFGHDFSVPDLDRRTAMTVTGRLVGGRLMPTSRDGSIVLPPLPRLWERLQAHRRLGKACRRALTTG